MLLSLCPESFGIFLMAFNPILEFLQENRKFGYKMGESEHFITLPYADDFCLISTDLRTHQRLINQITEKINSMGMKIKPSKCRSFSIRSGKISNVKYFIEDKPVPSTQEEEQKFLGRVLFHDGKSEDCFNLLKETIENKIENLNKTKIREEYKIEIYSMYILPLL